MRIFLAGGTGFVGGHLRCALQEEGHEIHLLTHRRTVCREPGIEQVEGDVTRPETYAGAVAGCDAVINLVGIIREFPARGIIFERLHGEATRCLVLTARKAGVRRFLQMSALGTGPNAVSSYHRSKYRAEEEVRNSGLDWTIFRPSVIFGPKDDFINRLAGFVRKLPVVPVIGDGSCSLQPIDGGDVARCFTMALEMPETVGKTYELCGQERVTYLELIAFIGRVLGKRTVRTVRLPLSLMEMVTPFLQRFAFFPVTRDQIRMLREDNVCDGAWRETFRFDPVGLEEGIRVYLGNPSHT
jgi:NADH dehydrogenase